MVIKENSTCFETTQYFREIQEIPFRISTQIDKLTIVFGVQTCIHHSSVSPITSHVNACAGMNNTLATHTESKTGLTQTFPFHCVINLQSVADAYFNNSVQNTTIQKDRIVIFISQIDHLMETLSSKITNKPY